MFVRHTSIQIRPNILQLQIKPRTNDKVITDAADHKKVSQPLIYKVNMLKPIVNTNFVLRLM